MSIFTQETAEGTIGLQRIGPRTGFLGAKAVTHYVDRGEITPQSQPAPEDTVPEATPELPPSVSQETAGLPVLRGIVDTPDGAANLG